jgi:uncharacterized protein DUF4190
MAAPGMGGRTMAAPGTGGRTMATPGMAAPGTGGRTMAAPTTAAPGMAGPGMAGPDLAGPAAATPDMPIPGVPPPPASLPPNAGPFAAAPTATAPVNNESAGWTPAIAPRGSRRLNNAALASMIVSLASFVTCPLIGLVGAYLGLRAKKEIQETGDDGDGMATAGIVVGFIATGVAAVTLLVVAMVLAFAAGAASVNN